MESPANWAVVHVVHVPDLYDGAMFADIKTGVAHSAQVGLSHNTDRAAARGAPLPTDLVRAGFSPGELPAQRLAQTRPGARGALPYHDGVPTSTFGAPWPSGIPLQMHLAESDK